MADADLVKVAFELTPDEDGYPPDRWETLWATQVDYSDLYRIDNIPIFVKGISSEDVVLAKQKDGQLVFSSLVKPSKNSVFRLFVSDPAKTQTARDQFRELGCQSEQSFIPKLFAFEVPGDVLIDPVLLAMVDGAESGLWEYEEGVLRHPLPS